MPRFLLLHRHEPHLCASSWSAWNGYPSPLRRLEVACTCLHGGHEVWWEVECASADLALALLPPYVAAQTEAVAMRRVLTP